MSASLTQTSSSNMDTRNYLNLTDHEFNELRGLDTLIDMRADSEYSDDALFPNYQITPIAEVYQNAHKLASAALGNTPISFDNPEHRHYLAIAIKLAQKQGDELADSSPYNVGVRLKNIDVRVLRSLASHRSDGGWGDAEWENCQVYDKFL